MSAPVTTPSRALPGRCLWSEGDLLIRARGAALEASENDGRTFTGLGRLALGRPAGLFARHRLGARLWRAGVKHCERVDADRFLVFAAGGVFRLDLAAGTLREVNRIHGSRPLRVCATADAVYYGEYRSNPERDPITVWRSRDLGDSWEPAHVFEGVRHVHAVQRDPVDGSIWVTTGDYGDEACLWRFEPDLTDPEPVLRGDQQCRVIDVRFEPERLVFGTDAPLGPNRLYALARGAHEPVALHEVAGPVFHAAGVGDSLLFSTAVEPGDGSGPRACEVLRLRGEELAVMGRFAKDRWSMRYFGYGEVAFAAGPGRGDGIWISPTATERDGTSLYLTLP